MSEAVMRPPTTPTGSEHALDALIARRLLALVWLDSDLTIAGQLGALIDPKPRGMRAVEAFLPLAGMEGELEALRRQPGEHLVMAGVGVAGRSAEAAKLCLQVIWLPESERYLVAVMPDHSLGQLEIDLRRESQRRRLLEQREAELAGELKQANEELLRANRDLEEFAYVLSHDLKAPLRAMRFTSELAEQDLTEGRTAEATENLRLIRTQARRMAAMITGLLEYSRIGRKEEAITAVDTRRLIEDIVASMRTAHALALEIEGDWPVIETTAEPLDRVLRNLVENAIKHHDSGHGRVRIAGSRDASGTWGFEVEDDGPGIAPEMHSVIFEPFRTLGKGDAQESSGIGLALVKRTVDLAGGRIDVHSDPAVRRGTVFRVCWPAAPTRPAEHP